MNAKDFEETGNYQVVEKKAADIAKLLKALSNEKRLLIVCALCESEKSVGELEQQIDLSQSALSQHLARLRRDGIVKTRREAQTIFYSLKENSPRIVLNCLCKLFSGTCS